MNKANCRQHLLLSGETLEIRNSSLYMYLCTIIPMVTTKVYTKCRRYPLGVRSVLPIKTAVHQQTACGRHVQELQPQHRYGSCRILIHHLLILSCRFRNEFINCRNFIKYFEIYFPFLFACMKFQRLIRTHLLVDIV